MNRFHPWFSKIPFAKFPVAFTLAFALTWVSGCNKKKLEIDSGMSQEEYQAMTEAPFTAEDHMTGVEGDPFSGSASGGSKASNEDSLIPRNDFLLDDEEDSCPTAHKFIRHCDPAQYEKELQSAMTEAAQDPEQKTIVVRYSLSFGTPFDTTAYFAFKRSVLRAHDDGITPIPIAPEDNLDYDYYAGSNAAHYFASHAKARRDYINGSRCFFNTVKVVSKENGPILKSPLTGDHVLPGELASCGSDAPVYDHSLNLMYYGDAYSCTSSDCQRRDQSPRLFKAVESVTGDIRQALSDFANNNPTAMPLSEFIKKCPTPNRPQIIPLYVADLREQRIGLPEVQGQLINPSFASSATRRYEYQVQVKKILDLRTLWWNRDAIARELRKTKTVSDFYFDGYVGASQLIDNLIFSGLNGTVMSTQYTPIVLDLPIGDTAAEYEANRHIHTSSLEWGTFFDLANLRFKTTLNQDPQNLHHLTAWVGGKLEKDPDTGAYVRTATDGFLALPEIKKDALGNAMTCPNGSPDYDIPRAENLFGSFATVKGTVTKYVNGFQKLRAWTSTHSSIPKDCSAPRDEQNLSAWVKSRYLGPWDGEAFSQIRVWLDRNRNGKVDCGEIMTLQEARIAAINTCNLNLMNDNNGEPIPVSDHFGNQTSYRSAFLVADSQSQLTEDEIIRRLSTGKNSSGNSAEFRAAIDILFRVNTGLYLEDVSPDLIQPDPALGTQ